MIRQVLRKREVVFAAADETAYSEILLAKQPNIRFIKTLSNDEKWGESEPLVTPHTHVHAVGASSVDILFPTGGWELRLQRDLMPTGLQVWGIAEQSRTFPNGYWWWLKGDKPFSRLRLPDGRIIQYIGGSDIVFRARASRPDEVRLIESLLRPIAKLSIRQMQLFELSAPEKPGTVVDHADRYWMGHHAVAWARESPDRYLACHSLGDGRIFGWRPLD